ncbi:MAG: PhoH family protein [Gammaproteobacteria bacterium]|nr:PhoH family protein [Gammaproteobacteria bacterium]
MTETKRTFVLDTSVLMHDPAALFKFAEHDVYIPMVVLEELDGNKKGMSEPARNARQASRFIDSMIAQQQPFKINDGLLLEETGAGLSASNGSSGRLYFQTEMVEDLMLDKLPGRSADNNILANSLALQKTHGNDNVTLISKDINLRIKSAVLGVQSEDYYSDKRITDSDVLFTGTQPLAADFWPTHSDNIESWTAEGRTFYKITGPSTEDWHINQFVYVDAEGEEEGSQLEAIVRDIEDDTATIELTDDHSSKKGNVWGVMARNREQNFALNLLMDDSIDLVTLLGAAGTGKTLLTLAAGLAQTLDQKLFREIIMTRVTIPLGDDIGFLPGTEEEKMEPWMGALMDNLEFLASTSNSNEWERDATADLIRHRIKLRSINFMRGRTFLNRYVIIDEAQNLTPKQMKAIITRAGPGSKIVCLGNIAQIDTPYLTETTSGLTYIVNRFKNWSHAGHVTLMRGERSRLADYASDNL